MGVDDQLRKGQESSREKARSQERTREDRARPRAAYHGVEEATAVNIAAAFRRAHQLLDDNGKWVRIQVWARPSLGPNRGLVMGREIPDLVRGYSHEVLLSTGHVAQVDGRTTRRRASEPLSIEDWAVGRVQGARMEGTYQGAGSLYRQAFDSPWGNPHALARMEERLRSIRGSVMEALGRMLADAEIEL